MLTARDNPERRRLRHSLRVLAALAVLAGAPAVLAGPPSPATKPVSRNEPNPGVDATTESSVLSFVAENHPELAEVLASLKPMRPEEYRKALRDLAQVKKQLSQVKERDPRRYELNLEAWKLRSRVELIAARLASSGTNPELESELRRAVESQVDLEIRRLRFEKTDAEERLRKVSENLARLEDRRDASIESRVQATLKKSQSARRPPAGQAKPRTENGETKPIASPRKDAESRPHPRASSSAGSEATRGERQP